VYRVEGIGTELAFTANASRRDSMLSPMDHKVIEDWWAPASVEILNADGAAERLAQQANHWPLWPALVLIAGLLLIAETIYVHRLCPRTNPKAADAVVPVHGLMKSVVEKSA